MSNRSTQRRTQFSSCDACRHSRVACDASKIGHQPGQVRWRGSCSRCSIRKRPCTFEWVKSVKNNTSNTRPNSSSQSPKTRIDPFIPYQLPNQTVLVGGSKLGQPHISVPELRPTEPLDLEVGSADILLTQWSDQIFRQGFETIFGLSVGRYGCPLVNNPTSDMYIPAVQLFTALDSYTDQELDLQNHDYASEAAERRQQRNDSINQSLRCAIRSFASQWLPQVTQRDPVATRQAQNFIKDSWRAARRDMLKVINRPCYRSVLTLYLFNQTPTPVGIPEHEELDGISRSVCLQTALLQVQQLRERLESRQSNGVKVPTWTGVSESSAQSTIPTQAYLDLESRAYWAAVMCDTLSSLTSSSRTSLTSGLKGGCSEPAWRLARSFLVGSFHPATEHLRTTGIEVSDELVCRINSAATTSTLYIWKNIASLKQALREGEDEESLLFAWKALLDAIDFFQTSIRPLLNDCEKRLHFLDQASRLTCYKVNSRYHLGILVLVDAIEAAGRSDLLPGVTAAKQEAEHESINVLKFGIESTYMLYGSGEDSATASKSVDTTDILRRPIAASVLAIDPHPPDVVELVRLMNKVISRKYREGEIKHATYSYLSSILLKALEHLPQGSKLVQAARENLQRSLHNE